MFDISSISTEDTYDIAVLDPRTGEPLIGEGNVACSVTVYAPGTREFAAAQSKSGNRAVKRLRAKGAKADTTPEEDLAARASFLTDVTVSFNGFTYAGGDAKATETHRGCYGDLRMGWLTTQVNDGVGDWGNASTSGANS